MKNDLMIFFYIFLLLFCSPLLYVHFVVVVVSVEMSESEVKTHPDPSPVRIELPQVGNV